MRRVRMVKDPVVPATEGLVISGRVKPYSVFGSRSAPGERVMVMVWPDADVVGEPESGDAPVIPPGEGVAKFERSNPVGKSMRRRSSPPATVRSVEGLNRKT